MPVLRPRGKRRPRKQVGPEKEPWYLKIAGFGERYWRPLAVGVGALLLTAAALVGWYLYRENREYKASTVLARVDAEIAEAMEAAAAEASSPEDVDKETIFRESIAKYEEVAERYGDTAAGRIAKYKMANLYFELGETGEARKYFKESARGRLKVFAEVGIADSYRAEGEDEKAAALYEKVRKDSGGAFPYVHATLKLAGIKEDLGELDEARALYQEVLDYYGGSPFAGDAAEGLMRVKAKAELAAE